MNCPSLRCRRRSVETTWPIGRRSSCNRQRGQIFGHDDVADFALQDFFAGVTEQGAGRRIDFQIAALPIAHKDAIGDLFHQFTIARFTLAQLGGAAPAQPVDQYHRGDDHADAVKPTAPACQAAVIFNGSNQRSALNSTPPDTGRSRSQVVRSMSHCLKAVKPARHRCSLQDWMSSGRCHGPQPHRESGALAGLTIDRDVPVQFQGDVVANG